MNPQAARHNTDGVSAARHYAISTRVSHVHSIRFHRPNIGTPQVSKTPSFLKGLTALSLRNSADGDTWKDWGGGGGGMKGRG
jgi:hypothetical protein